MEDLKGILKQFIEEQRNRETSSGPRQGSNSESEEKLREQGFDPDSIRDFINNIPPEEATDQVIEDIFKLIGKDTTFIKPTRVSDEGFISRSTLTKETEQGLEREVVKPLIIASCGKVIREDEIGVRCSICNEYDEKEHAFVCHSCGNGVCIRHVCFSKNEKGENVPYCPACYEKVVYNQYMW